MYIQKINIDKIIINEDNPRNESQSSESDAVKLLLKKEIQLLNLMRDIAENGLDISERAILSPLEGTDLYIAMDGNRRITCIKLLNSIDFLPSDINIKDYDRLSKKSTRLL